MNIKAWESEEAKDQAGRYSSPYLDRPVADPSWTKVSDTPIEGLAVYRTSKSPSAETSRNPLDTGGSSPSEESPSSTKESPSSGPDQLEMSF